MKLVGSKTVVRVALAVLAIVVALGTFGVAALKTTHAAPSDSVPHYVINGPWYLHPGNLTDTPSISSSTGDLMPTGTEFDVQCVATGDASTPDSYLAADGNGDAAWEYGTDAAIGDTGFVSDQVLDTQVNPGNEVAQLEAQGIPSCGNDSSATGTQTVSSQLQPAVSLQGSQAVPNGYNRQAVANWALTYAPLNSINTVGADESCTWFVSLALWSNGFPSDQQWNWDGSHGFRHPLPGTATAWVASDLIDHLRSVYNTSYTEISFDNGGFVNVSIKPGDIIAYDLGYKPNSGYPFKPDHVAIVVDVLYDPVNGDYPEVAEWGHPVYYYKTNMLADYAKRGWTWSAVYGTWLQSWYNDVQYGGSPNTPNSYSGISIKAYLLHFNF